METVMLAYHSDPKLKARVVRQILAHQKADRVIKGTYARLGMQGQFQGGCAVGCTLESLRRIEKLPTIEHGNHSLYERYLGIPRVLARLEDGIFEGLPEDDALTWPARFTQAIRPGADLSMVWPRFALDLLTAPDSAVVQVAQKHPALHPAIVSVAALYQRWINGTKPADVEWKRARSAAISAISVADAYAAAAADAAAVAADVADADTYADTYAHAAYVAASAYTAAAKRLTERRRQADVLIRLLESV